MNKQRFRVKVADSYAKDCRLSLEKGSVIR